MVKKTEEYLKQIVETIINQYRPEKILLFGSYAHGNPDSDSDIDLLIIKDTSKRFIDRWTEIRSILSNSKRLISIEPLVLTPTEVSQRLEQGDQFIEEVFSSSETLYVRCPQVTQTIRKTGFA